MDNDIKSLNDIDKAFENMIKGFPNARSNLVDNACNIMENKVIEIANSELEEHTGNYNKGIKQFKGSRGGWCAIRNTSSHAYLIEFGHKLVRGGTLSKKRYAKNIENTGKGKVEDWVDGKYIYKKALLETADKLEEAAEKMLKDLGDIFGR